MENQTKIEISKNDKIAKIVFSSPSHNSLTKAGMKQLAEEIDRLGEDPNVLCILIQSGGDRTFCAGADFGELCAANSSEDAIAFFDGFAGLYSSMVACPKIIICRVQGKAVGGAIGIIAAADVALATSHAAVKLSELNVGIGPFVVGPIIEYQIGAGNLAKLTFSPNDFFSPEWALSVGLYGEVLPDIETLDARAKEKAEELCGYNPAALTQIKREINPDPNAFRKLLDDRKKISAELLLTDFTRQRLRELTR